MNSSLLFLYLDDMTVSRFGVWSTMLDKGAVLLTPADWPRGVRIVLVTKGTGELCGQHRAPESSDPPHFNITVGPNGSFSDTIIATVIVTVFYLLIGLLVICMSCFVLPCLPMFNVSRIDEKTMSEIRDNSNGVNCSVELQKEDVYKKSQLYYEAVCIIGIFYALPAVQMALKYIDEQKTSGNQDICYYNDLCRRGLGSLSDFDFNHLFREGFF